MFKQSKRTEILTVTVLRRHNGTWARYEVDRFTRGLQTDVCEDLDFPEYLLLFGHFTKAETIQVIREGNDYTATQVTGSDSCDLPFKPRFI